MLVVFFCCCFAFLDVVVVVWALILFSVMRKPAQDFNLTCSSRSTVVVVVVVHVRFSDQSHLQAFINRSVPSYPILIFWLSGGSKPFVIALNMI